MDLSAAITVAIVALVLFSDRIYVALKRGYDYLSTLLPSTSGIFTAKVELPIWKVVAIVGALWFVSSGGCTLPPIAWPVIPSPATKATAVTYVYEKDDGGIPSGVTAALGTLNARDITATVFEDDTVDASGSVPDQYKVALAEAKTQGVPLLVVQGGVKVIRTVKAPTTTAAVLEAVP